MSDAKGHEIPRLVTPPRSSSLNVVEAVRAAIAAGHAHYFGIFVDVATHRGTPRPGSCSWFVAAGD